jgi:hypothetical protein
MSEPIRFACCYCHYQIAAAAEQAECIRECPGCGRSVLVPSDSQADRWPAPLPPSRGVDWLGSAIVSAAAALFGGAIVGTLLFGLMHALSVRWIGVSFGDAVIAGCVGFALGMCGFGVLGWNIATR